MIVIPHIDPSVPSRGRRQPSPHLAARAPHVEHMEWVWSWFIRRKATGCECASLCDAAEWGSDVTLLSGRLTQS